MSISIPRKESSGLPGIRASVTAAGMKKRDQCGKDTVGALWPELGSYGTVGGDVWS